ncbi:hypothetical protein H6G58_03175 [Arthrospira platensis FACHB-971]|nr:hypothetical protein [Arthrospira platensis]MBD2572035.1 hypothetical protein [Arthrospira platensis FACHB-971]MDF2212292.1 hypothetical protein [Arthrospira platensis NCB002]MDT9182555.1 hypothetical protein [Limnospira sp. PMC 289.06]MDT9295858.1 hypothetical protein [Arthrospira platensis PCC 7345]QQW27649.1 hypothetical protein AP9108_20915 [Arthrospira sp. PCC 9108]
MTVAQLPADYLYRYFLTPSTQSRFPPRFLMAARAREAIAFISPLT